MTREGQVWTGPLLDDPEAPSLYLVLRRHPERADIDVVLDLATGKVKDMYLRNIEEDANWRRIA